MNKDLENLRDAKKIFDKHGIVYWLDAGTLLGIFRNGKLIEWDTDIDLGAMMIEWKKFISLIPELENNGFSVFTSGREIVKRMHLYRHSIPIDIGLYYINGSHAVTEIVTATGLVSRIYGILHQVLVNTDVFVQPKFVDITRLVKLILSRLPLVIKGELARLSWKLFQRSFKNYSSVVVPKCFFNDLGTIVFQGMKFKVPRCTEEFLECKYGKDWRNPIDYTKPDYRVERKFPVRVRM